MSFYSPLTTPTPLLRCTPPSVYSEQLVNWWLFHIFRLPLNVFFVISPSGRTITFTINIYIFGFSQQLNKQKTLKIKTLFVHVAPSSKKYKIIFQNGLEVEHRERVEERWNIWTLNYFYNKKKHKNNKRIELMFVYGILRMCTNVI